MPGSHASLSTQMPTELLLQQGLEPTLLSTLSNIIVILMTNLRQSLLQRPEGAAERGHGLRLLRGELQQLLGGITQGVLFQRSGPKMRQNQYGSLLFYLQIAQDALASTVGDGAGLHESSAMGRTLARLGDGGNPLRDLHQGFMDAVCRDACDSSGITCVLALSALTELVAMDPDQRWLAFMDRFGYLRHYVEELKASDESLMRLLLQSPPSNFNALYKFQRRIALLLRVVSTVDGVAAVRESQVLSALGQCSFLGNRPSSTSIDGTPYTG